MQRVKPRKVISDRSGAGRLTRWFSDKGIDVLFCQMENAIARTDGVYQYEKRVCHPVLYNFAP